MVQTGKSLNIHPTALFIPLTRLALFHPLAVWKEDRQSPYPVGLGAYFEKKGPFEELSPGGHPIMTNTLPLLASSLAILLSAGNVCARVAKETGLSWPCHWNFGPLSRSGGLLLYQRTSCFKWRLANTPQLAVSSSPKETHFSCIV